MFSFRIACVSFWCCLLMFCFLIVENCIANILKDVLPASHHRFIDLYLYFSSTQLFPIFRKFCKTCFQTFMFNDRCINFPKPFPLGFVLVTLIVRIRPSWSRKYRYIFEFLIFSFINSIYSTMYRSYNYEMCVFFA